MVEEVLPKVEADDDGAGIVVLVVGFEFGLVRLALFDIDAGGRGGDWWAWEAVTVVRRRRRPGGRDMLIS